ncbi:unnamed protein product [Amoebophrya sp. A25]|nr:unnamed protein product [Amoebophrya sp. A25]|eukprot:GSA25T00010608001.1
MTASLPVPARVLGCNKHVDLQSALMCHKNVDGSRGPRQLRPGIELYLGARSTQRPQPMRTDGFLHEEELPITKVTPEIWDGKYFLSIAVRELEQPEQRFWYMFRDHPKDLPSAHDRQHRAFLGSDEGVDHAITTTTSRIEVDSPGFSEISRVDEHDQKFLEQEQEVPPHHWLPGMASVSPRYAALLSSFSKGTLGRMKFKSPADFLRKYFPPTAYEGYIRVGVPDLLVSPESPYQIPPEARWRVMRVVLDLTEAGVPPAYLGPPTDFYHFSIRITMEVLDSSEHVVQGGTTSAGKSHSSSSTSTTRSSTSQHHEDGQHLAVILTFHYESIPIEEGGRLQQGPWQRGSMGMGRSA